MPSAPPFTPHDPDWLAHRHVESEDALRFLHVPRPDRGAVSFLIDANLGERGDPVTLPLGECLARFERPAIAWIFHSAFCGSTLLAHALDLPGTASSLSEPMLLNDVVGLRRRGASPAAVARLADAALRALGRPYPGEGRVVIKPSNVVNPLAELLLALQPSAPALYLYAPLETFLISVARKGLPCRLWVRELLEGYLRENYVALGFAPEDYFRQSDLQVAATGWLAQHGHFARLAGQLGPDRLRMFDADLLLAEPERVLAAAGAHLGVPLDAVAIAAGPAFRRNSKSGEAYTRADRDADYASARASHGEEIELVLRWAERVADAAGIDLAPPAPLRLLQS
jgi:hypothetical protein